MTSEHQKNAESQVFSEEGVAISQSATGNLERSETMSGKSESRGAEQVNIAQSLIAQSPAAPIFQSVIETLQDFHRKDQLQQKLIEWGNEAEGVK